MNLQLPVAVAALVLASCAAASPALAGQADPTPSAASGPAVGVGSAAPTRSASPASPAPSVGEFPPTCMNVPWPPVSPSGDGSAPTSPAPTAPAGLYDYDANNPTPVGDRTPNLRAPYYEIGGHITNNTGAPLEITNWKAFPGENDWSVAPIKQTIQPGRDSDYFAVKNLYAWPSAGWISVTMGEQTGIAGLQGTLLYPACPLTGGNAPCGLGDSTYSWPYQGARLDGYTCELSTDGPFNVTSFGTY